MKRIGMLTSGGDCQALNAAMRGVVKCLVNSKENVEIYGFIDGYKGLIYGNFRMLGGHDFSGILTKGGTIFISCVWTVWLFWEETEPTRQQIFFVKKD